ncbi:unnamed protein product [Schistosoma mattheei]|uniref:Reverse transcriptase domain-containing protein n=2 Tax=Schistosoma TaxID=6181 RepID=A0A3P8HMN7_9TREM|nr:unnamed protein product [Schistosoma mattheei]
MDFADDLAFVSNTHEQIQINTASVAAISASVGLKIHKGKTKVLKYDTEDSNPVTFDGEALEDVESFIIDEQGGSDADVKARIGKARAAFLELLAKQWDKELTEDNQPNNKFEKGDKMNLSEMETYGLRKLDYKELKLRLVNMPIQTRKKLAEREKEKGNEVS